MYQAVKYLHYVHFKGREISSIAPEMPTQSILNRNVWCLACYTAHLLTVIASADI